FEQANRTLSASYLDSLATHLEHGAGRRRAPGISGGDFGFPALHSLIAQHEPGTRFGIVGAYLALEFYRRQAEVEPGLGLVDFPGVGRTAFVLRLRSQAPVEDLRQVPHEQFAPELTEPLCKLACRMAGIYANRLLDIHRTGVEPCFHVHQADARLAVPAEDGGLDRRGAAPSRQQ